MKLGIIGAMEQEVETLLRQMTEKTCLSKAGSDFYEGKLEGVDAVVVRCGIGKVNAALCAQILCDAFAVTHIVNTGIAGSLSNDLDIGDRVISRDAMYPDFDCCNFGYAPGQVPGLPVSIPADDTLIRLAKQAVEEVHPGHSKEGRVVSGDLFVSHQEQKDAIIAKTGALCTEMEGAAIAQAAHRNGVPFVILRAISDKADNSAQMDYPAFEQQAAHRCAAVTLTLAKMMK